MGQTTVGFIGFGNMAQAMAKGFVTSGALPGEAISACAKHWDKLQQKTGALGAVPCQDAAQVVERSDLVILAVKPYLIEEVLAPIGDKLSGKVLLSVAAGWSFDRFEAILPAGVHHLTLMPNTPVAIGEGVLLLEEEHALSPEELAQVKELLSALGEVATVPAAQMGIAGTIADRLTPPCFWRLWATPAYATACPGSFPTAWPPRCLLAPENSTWPPPSIPAL